MITDTDIKKLEKVFATKNELKANTKSIVKEIHTLIEIMGETNERIDRTNQELAETNQNVADIIVELKANRIVLGSHESRIQKLESCSM